MAKFQDKAPIYVQGCWHPVTWWRYTKEDGRENRLWQMHLGMCGRGVQPYRYFALVRDGGWFFVESVEGGCRREVRSGPHKLLADAQQAGKQWVLANMGEATPEQRAQVEQQYAAYMR